jgi:leucyl aminopeptidase (aminopeptidase T)
VNYAIHHILRHCGGAQWGDIIFIIADDSTMDIAKAFREEAERYGGATVMTNFTVAHHGEEPPDYIARRMQFADLTISLCRNSLAHTKARLGANRFLSLPGYSWELLKHPAVMVDYEAQAANVKRFADAFTNGKEVRVMTTPLGVTATNVTMNIEGRKGNACPGFVRKPGDLGSPPDIEANVAPIEDSANGPVCSDSGLVHFHMIGGYATSNLKLFGFRPEHSILGELGVGLNPLAKICGHLLIDEGAFGSVHFGFGSNLAHGGKNHTDFHYDFIMKDATLWVDGVKLLADGVIC